MASAKIFSLFVRTLSKPVAGYIKNQAHQHEGFKRICIGLGQSMYKTETMMRINLLMTPKQRERERRKIEEEAAKRKAREEAQRQKEADEAAEKARQEAIARGEEPPEPPSKSAPDPEPSKPEADKDGQGQGQGQGKGKGKEEEPPSPPPRSTWRSWTPFFFNISQSPLMAAFRPLSDHKALERGAQSFSELFIFSVAAALILAETFRGRSNRRKDKNAAEERLDELTEVVRLLASQLDQLEAHRVQSPNLAKRLANALAGDAPVSDRRPLFDFDALVAEAKRRVAQAEAEAEAAEQAAQTTKDNEGIQSLFGHSGKHNVSSTSVTTPPDSNAGPDRPPLLGVKAASPLEFMEAEAENESLRATVAALLRLAMKNGLLESDLDLNAVATSSASSRTARLDKSPATATAPVFPLSPSQPNEDDTRTHVQRLADARARAIVAEVRDDMAARSEQESGSGSSSLADMLTKATSWNTPQAA